jgi:hypothetical protein
MITTPPPTGFRDFKTQEDRASNKLSLEKRLLDYDTMYRQSAPSPSGKGAPGIDDQTKGAEGEGANFFGYGSKTTTNPFGGGDASSLVSNANATGSVKIKGFTTKKSAGNKVSDYGHGKPGDAADASFYRDGKIDSSKDKYSSYISGFTGTQRQQDGGDTAGRSRSGVGNSNSR